ncbi:hypothetical protein G7K_6329-t1 [Saitoella complicata NRRL Y-17804]|uniref:Secreted protein n=1 Tax=Saitoella complicata (strain BCRC 22490 / CBS 7301 / JCM 7358 / NBRC 10748 / NRRL Y-17804) TaxID=698492 RepID=A0A0E9NR21_SAICN|nr:hypothetical protein G7K_6329-t1 [Saitoella complicata NRRL Y-17804]
MATRTHPGSSYNSLLVAILVVALPWSLGSLAHVACRQKISHRFTAQWRMQLCNAQHGTNIRTARSSPYRKQRITHDRLGELESSKTAPRSPMSNDEAQGLARSA